MLFLYVSPVIGQVTPAQIDSALNATRWTFMKEIQPRHYVASFADTHIHIDGILDEDPWKNASWSELFVDIEGDRKPRPHFRTRMKITWDNQYLYVAAVMEEPHLWATLTEKNSVIYRDHDFEVFVDPNGDNHNYYEFEVNAFNTIWELRLIRPYRNGGPVINPDNMDGVLSSVHLAGTINDPSDTDEGWTVELAFPFSGFGTYGTDGSAPTEGDQWRVNFSRVQRNLRIEDEAYVSPQRTPPWNWTWSPQGAIAMHMPERWGYLQFAGSGVNSNDFVPDISLPARDLLMEVFYYQQAFQKLTGVFSTSLSELGLEPTIEDYRINMWQVGDGYSASIELLHFPSRGPFLYVNERGRLWHTE